MNDLDLARQRHQLRVLQGATEDREAMQRYRELYDAEQATNPGFPRDDPPGRRAHRFDALAKL